MKLILIINVSLMLGISIYLDIRYRRISNTYNLCWMIYGLIFSAISFSDGLLYSLLGMAIPVVGLMVLFKAKVLGAGDIKLLAAVGSFLGLQVLWVIVYSFVMCALYGVWIVMRRLIEMYKNGQGLSVAGLLSGGVKGCTKVAFSVFIGLGYGWYVAGIM